MSIRRLASLIGQTTMVSPIGWPKLNFEVRVVDVRLRYGNVDVLVQPVAGDGEHWICADHTTLNYAE